MASTLENNTNTINDLLTTINNLPNALTLDTTLTQSGQAADAKAVGDRFDGLNVKNGEGAYSVVIGEGSATNGKNELAIGKYNTADLYYEEITEITPSNPYPLWEEVGDTCMTISSPQANLKTGKYEYTIVRDNMTTQRVTRGGLGGNICVYIDDGCFVICNDNLGTNIDDYSVDYGELHIIKRISNISAFTIGNGTSDTERSNAHTVDWEGNGWFAGDVYVGGANKYSATKLAKNIQDGKDEYSTVAGLGTSVIGEAEFAIGKYNKIDKYDIVQNNNYFTKVNDNESYQLVYNNGSDHIGNVTFNENTGKVEVTGNITETSNFYEIMDLIDAGYDVWIVLSENSYAEIQAYYESAYYIHGTQYMSVERSIAFAVGNGASDNARSDAHTIDWDGNAWFAGDVSVGSDKKKLTKEGHTHTPNNITSGTFAGIVYASSSSQAPTVSLLRNSKLVSTETTPTNNGEIFWTYE